MVATWNLQRVSNINVMRFFYLPLFDVALSPTAGTVSQICPHDCVPGLWRRLSSEVAEGKKIAKE